jgi:protease-4
MPARTHLFLSSALLLLSAAARADRPTTPLGGEPPTAGVRLDAPSLLADADPSGVEVNPASVGLLQSWALMYRHTNLPDSGRFGGTGDAFLFGSPLPFLNSMAVGLGFQWLRPPDAIGYADSVKLSLAVALRIKGISLGLGYHGFIADDDTALDGLDTLDVGLTVRPFEWAGVGLVVRDLTTPVYAGLPLQRVYDLELAGRPLSTDRLEVGLGLRIGERRGDLDPYLRIEVEPLNGVRLVGGVELVRRDFHRTGETLTDVRGVVGLGLNLERIGLAFSTFLGRELDTGPGPLGGSSARSSYQGFGVTLRLNGERREPLFTTRDKLLLLELTDELDERRWTKAVLLLREVERRRDLRGVLLNIDGLQCGWAQAQELRRWMRRLRKAGKKSYIFLRAPDDRGYYIAAAADNVLLDPGGGIRLDGLVFRTLYFRGLLDLVGANPQFVKIAEFKSAPESFTRRTASPAAREVREALLNDLYGQLLHDLASDRRKTAVKMREIIDRGPYTPPRALAAGLVDRLVAPDELKSVVKKMSGAKLIKPSSLGRTRRRWPVGPSIAVVLVEGDIVRGKSVHIPFLGRRMVGDQTITEAVRRARASDSVKAVVIRVNSPGGSAMASDAMWREIRRTAKVKPVVISMGDVAASGGYYVAAGGNRIFAEPATLTGSIGIFTGKFDLSGVMKHLGINVDASARGKRATMEGFERPYTKEERRFILDRLQYYYRGFLRAVSDARRMSQDKVHAVARGRVWTGRQARGKGLVDRHGGLMEAIEEAQRRAGLPLDRELRVTVVPEPRKGLLSRLLSLTGRAGDRLSDVVPGALRRLLRALPPVLLRARSGEPLARMPYTIQLD